MTTESRGYAFTGVKTASYSKLSVPGYTAIKYRSRPSAADQAAMRAQLLLKEGNDGTIASGKRIASGAELEGEPTKKKSKWEEDEETETNEVVQVEINPLDRDDSDSESPDADSGDGSDSDDDDDDDEELAEIQRQLERIKREKADAKAKEDQDAADAAERDREAQIASGNPLMMGQDEGRVAVKKWFEETIFTGQAAGEQQYKKRFINDTVRNDFHKRFLAKYVR